MNFKELAPLRDKLAQQAAAEKLLQQRNKKALPEKKTAPVDPVVLVIRQLQKQFPKAFPKNPAPKVPLKIGIHRDLLEQSELLKTSRKALREAIKTWCSGNRYWACIVENAVRVDLKGESAGCVTKEEADKAKSLKTLRQNKKTNKPKPIPAEEASVATDSITP